MKNKLFFIFTLLTLVSCSNEERAPMHSNEFISLWKETVSVSLDDALWQNEYAYDAAASLMVPMHYAYKYPNRFPSDPRKEFDQFIENTYFYVDFSSFEGNVTKAQFLYLITQNLKLEQSRNNLNLEILDWAMNQVVYSWQTEKFSIWTDLVFEGVRERLIWNLAEPTTDYSFYRAVIDKEWFTLAAMNDLASIYSKAELEIPFNNDEVQALSKQVISDFGVFEQDYWFFQKGIWHDHRDYRYAGNERITDDMEEQIINTIGIDSNHLHRLPLWLTSFAENNVSAAGFYDVILSAHKHTYESLVLTQLDSDSDSVFTLLQNNFSTGENGVYRYNYVTQGPGNGYQNYELSGTLFIGYYSFLQSDKYTNGMKKMVEQFPLSQEALKYYVGPNTNRERHPLFSWPAYFENGFAEVFSRVVACYNSSLSECE